MKNSNKIAIILTSFALVAGARAQVDGGSGLAIGVGLGVGVGTGVGANVQVVRVPGNVVGGRRVFAAVVMSGSQTVTNQIISPGGGGSVLGIQGIARGWGSGYAQFGTLWTKEYATIINIYNPGATPATFSSPSASLITTPPMPVTLPPGGRQSFYFGGTNWLGPEISPPPLGAGPVPAPFLPFTTDFLAIESTSPLEVVAIYRYRDERVDWRDEAWIETAAGYLIGP